MIKKLQVLVLTVLVFGFAKTNAEVKTVVIDAPNGAVSTFYNFESGIVKSDSVAKWDLAFMTGMDAAVRINDLASLWLVPSKNIDDFGKPLDTTGISSWESLYNSDTTYNIGAFNLGLDGFDSGTGDYGWGSYDMTSHGTLGTKLFVIKIPAGFKQITIESMMGGVYTFKYANLDGTNPKTVELDKKAFGNRMFVYYSLANETTHDREPEATSWDLVWGKYLGRTPAPTGGFAWYSLTGMRQNVRQVSAGGAERLPAGVRVAEVDNVQFATVATPTNDKFGGHINEIGDDWKTFVQATFSYSYKPNVYFAQRFDNKGIPSGDIYKLGFTSFSGGKNVSATFSQEKVIANSVEENPVLNNFALSPNLVNQGENINLIYSAKANDLTANFSIVNVLGERLATYNFTTNQDFKAVALPTQNLSTGVYWLVFDNQKSSSIKFIVR